MPDPGDSRSQGRSVPETRIPAAVDGTRGDLPLQDGAPAATSISVAEPWESCSRSPIPATSRGRPAPRRSPRPQSRQGPRISSAGKAGVDTIWRSEEGCGSCPYRQQIVKPFRPQDGSFVTKSMVREADRSQSARSRCAGGTKPGKTGDGRRAATCQRKAIHITPQKTERPKIAARMSQAAPPPAMSSPSRARSSKARRSSQARRSSSLSMRSFRCKSYNGTAPDQSAIFGTRCAPGAMAARILCGLASLYVAGLVPQQSRHGPGAFVARLTNGSRRVVEIPGRGLRPAPDPCGVSSPPSGPDPGSPGGGHLDNPGPAWLGWGRCWFLRRRRRRGNATGREAQAQPPPRP